MTAVRGKLIEGAGISRSSVLQAFAAQLGYATRKARAKLSEKDRLLFLAPIEDVMQDLGVVLRPDGTQWASLTNARPTVRHECELLAALATPEVKSKPSPPTMPMKEAALPSIEARLVSIEGHLAAMAQACQDQTNWYHINGATFLDSSSKIDASDSILSPDALPLHQQGLANGYLQAIQKLNV